MYASLNQVLEIMVNNIVSPQVVFFDVGLVN